MGVEGLDGVEASDEAEVVGEEGWARSESFRPAGFLIRAEEDALRPRSFIEVP